MTIDGYCTLGVDREFDLTEAALLEAMDAAGVERAVIVPPDRFLAVFNHEGNQNVLRSAGAYRDRFIPACSVNPWYGDQAIEEFQRALGEGARMLVLHPLVQGFTANDELVFPLLDIAAAERIPVYVHTGPPGNSTPWQIVDLAELFPSLDLIMGHCGATDFWNDVADAAVAAPNIYLESSLARPFHFARYMATAGKHKGIIGSWAPLNKLEFEWRQMRKFLTADVFAESSGANLARIFGKRAAL
ncbi:MAG: amidohydrolase family protein [Bryobacteraceae bacterium]